MMVFFFFGWASSPPLEAGSIHYHSNARMYIPKCMNNLFYHSHTRRNSSAVSWCPLSSIVINRIDNAMQ